MAALTIFIYDIMLSFGEEVLVMTAHASFHMLIHFTQVEYVWGSNISRITVLYFVVRYFTAINLMYVYLYCSACPSLNFQQFRNCEYASRISHVSAPIHHFPGSKDVDRS